MGLVLLSLYLDLCLHFTTPKIEMAKVFQIPPLDNKNVHFILQGQYHDNSLSS